MAAIRVSMAALSLSSYRGILVNSRMYGWHFKENRSKFCKYSILKYLLVLDNQHGYNFINKTLGRALDPRANGTWLSKLTEWNKK